jgi:hypothetical protein
VRGSDVSDEGARAFVAIVELVDSLAGFLLR